MEVVIIGIVITTAIVVSILFFLRFKKNAPYQLPTGIEKSIHTTKGPLISTNDNLQQLLIQMEKIPAEIISDRSKMIEITNSNVLAHVNHLVPELFQVGNTITKAAQAVHANSEVLYRVILPAGGELVKSRTLPGAFRPFSQVNGRIKNQANLIKVDPQKGTAALTKTMSSVMNVASMVVGQYYMAQIDFKLNEINNGISKISDFQNNEYRSKVFSLIAHVKKIADFQIEILENNELRTSKLTQLDRLEEDCTVLLGQANLSLKGYTKENTFDYTTYEKELLNIQNWYAYQKSLINILCKISELRYTLNLGTVSREQCNALLPTYANQVTETQNQLTNWHQTTAQRLGIEMNDSRRRRDGLDGALYFLPGLFNNDLNFKPIEKRTVNLIKDQLKNHSELYEVDSTTLYSEDIHLISQNGKIYFLPGGEANKETIQ